MPILSSIHTAAVQHDGRIAVHERHTDHTGYVHDVHWRAPAGTDEAEITLTRDLRAQRLGEALDARERAEAEAHNFELPLTRYQFLARFTAEEYATIKAAAAGNAQLDFYWQKLMSAGGVYLADKATVEGAISVRASQVLSG